MSTYVPTVQEQDVEHSKENDPPLHKEKTASITPTKSCLKKMLFIFLFPRKLYTCTVSYYPRVKQLTHPLNPRSQGLPSTELHPELPPAAAIKRIVVVTVVLLLLLLLLLLLVLLLLLLLL